MGILVREQQPVLASGSAATGSRPGGSDLPESEAIRRAQRGEADGFARIYQSHCRRVYALCLRMVGNTAEAEDLTQEAFLAVLRKIQTFRGESAFSTWLHRITVNVVLMRLRRKAVRECSPQYASEDNCSGPGAELHGCDLQLAGFIDRVYLERAIGQLTPSHQMVFDLHDVQGYKHKEIAKIMGWSIGNSKAQLHRARRRLRELLHEAVGMKLRVPERALNAQFSGG